MDGSTVDLMVYLWLSEDYHIWRYSDGIVMVRNHYSKWNHHVYMFIHIKTIRVVLDTCYLTLSVNSPYWDKISVWGSISVGLLQLMS